MALGLLGLAGLAGAPAGATTIEVQLASTITQINSAFEDTVPVAVGDDVRLRFQYDDAVPADDLSVFTSLVDTFALRSVTPIQSDLSDGGRVTALTVVLDQTVSGTGPPPTLVVDGRLNPPVSFGEGSSIILHGVTGSDDFINDNLGLTAGVVTVIPEPAAAVLLLVGMAPAVACLRPGDTLGSGGSARRPVSFLRCRDDTIVAGGCIPRRGRNALADPPCPHNDPVSCPSLLAGRG